MSFEQIDTEMKYSPPWYEDREYFLELWNSQGITADHQLITLARLYARYSHMDNNTLIICALEIILKKFGLVNKQSLFRKTQELYRRIYERRT